MKQSSTGPETRAIGGGDGEPAEQVLAAEQDERRRIALFLHDGPVQSLAGVALMLDASLDLIRRGQLEQAGEILDRAALEEAIRRGPPSRFEVTAAEDAPSTLRLVIRDDAPTERRRRALEVLG